MLKLQTFLVEFSEFYFGFLELLYFLKAVNQPKRVARLYWVRHVKCYRVIALKLLIISKNVSDKSFSVREGRHTRPPYFFIGEGAEATSRSPPLFLMEPCIFFSMTLLPILRRIQWPTTHGHSSHAKYENSRKIETYRNNHFQRIQ